MLPEGWVVSEKTICNSGCGNDVLISVYSDDVHVTMASEAYGSAWASIPREVWLFVADMIQKSRLELELTLGDMQDIHGTPA